MKAHQNIKELLAEGKKMLKENNIPEELLECQLFMMEATGLNKTQLYTQDSYCLTDLEAQTYFSMVDKRIKNIPTQYILGKAYFMDLKFKVTPDVLIPRGDTEILVEKVLEVSKQDKIEKIVDIGTGSGCIAISLKRYGIKEVWAVDVSARALNIAKENAIKNDAEIKFIESNLLLNISSDEKFDAIVSNPPYIVRDVIDELMSEVKCNEPHLALDGGEDGLDFYRQIVDQSQIYLNNNGWLFFEIGYDQGQSVSQLMEKAGYKNIEVLKDLSGMDRVVVGKKIGEN